MKYACNIQGGCIGNPVFISRMLVELKGIPYILPLGANTPPIHLELVVPNPVIVVVFAVVGSMINRGKLPDGIPYILPLGANTHPTHSLLR